MPDLYFLTSNDYKFDEYARCFANVAVAIDRWVGDLTEVQDVDLRTMARRKVLDAYQWILHPVLVDVSGMRLGALNGLPGGLNRQFWDILHTNVCDFVRKAGDISATMVVQLALCDGRRTYFGCGEAVGEIAPAESAVGTFHLDRVFMPTGSAVTLAELTDADRDKDGPRGRAVLDLLNAIRGTPFGRRIGVK